MTCKDRDQIDLFACSMIHDTPWSLRNSRKILGQISTDDIELPINHKQRRQDLIQLRLQELRYHDQELRQK